MTQTEAATVFEEFAKGGMYKISFLKAVAWHQLTIVVDGLYPTKKGGVEIGPQYIRNFRYCLAFLPWKFLVEGLA